MKTTIVRAVARLALMFLVIGLVSGFAVVAQRAVVVREELKESGCAEAPDGEVPA